MMFWIKPTTLICALKHVLYKQQFVFLWPLLLSSSPVAPDAYFQLPDF